MKIIKEIAPKKVRFDELSVGDVFIQGETVFMKVPEVSENFNLENIAYCNNALDLTACLFYFIKTNEEVEPCEAELRVRKI